MQTLVPSKPCSQRAPGSRRGSVTPASRFARSALIHKDPAFYGALFPDLPHDLSYVWPTTGRG